MLISFTHSREVGVDDFPSKYADLLMSPHAIKQHEDQSLVPKHHAEIGQKREIKVPT